MEKEDLQKLLLKNYVYIEHTPCGYVWGMISNLYYQKPMQAFEKIVSHINDLLEHDEMRVEKTKDDVVSYTIYHCSNKIITFYKSKTKNSKHGIMIINDEKALDIIIDTVT